MTLRWLLSCKQGQVWAGLKPLATWDLSQGGQSLAHAVPDASCSCSPTPPHSCLPFTLCPLQAVEIVSGSLCQAFLVTTAKGRSPKFFP